MKDKIEIVDVLGFRRAENRRTGRSHGPWRPAMFRWRDSDDDDDDPPPCPAVISPAPRLPPFGAEAELEAA